MDDTQRQSQCGSNMAVRVGDVEVQGHHVRVETGKSCNINARNVRTCSTSSSSPNDNFELTTPMGGGEGVTMPRAPAWLWRSVTAVVLCGQVAVRVTTKRKVHYRNFLDQLAIVGTGSLGVALLTSGFVGMAFTIQFVREFTRLGLTRSIGGVLALAMSRELSPVVTAIIIAGRVGSSFAAELGTMQVSEQTDSLRVLRTDPVDYLVTPRVLACMVALPVLTLFCFIFGMASSVLLAEWMYDVSANVIVDSAAKALQSLDLIAMFIKSLVGGLLISVISCAWGSTTTGGARGVGESTTSAVVIALVSLFVADFFMSFTLFQGTSDALKACM